MPAATSSTAGVVDAWPRSMRACALGGFDTIISSVFGLGGCAAGSLLWVAIHLSATGVSSETNRTAS